MHQSNWIVHLDASSESAVTKIQTKLFNLFPTPPHTSTIKTYYKGAYAVAFSLTHSEDLAWELLVYDILGTAQNLGGPWTLLGNVDDDLSGLLPYGEGTTIKVPGITMLQWNIHK